MRLLEQHGECAYWGYHTNGLAWNMMIKSLLKLNVSEAPALPRVCLEVSAFRAADSAMHL